MRTCWTRCRSGARSWAASITRSWPATAAAWRCSRRTCAVSYTHLSIIQDDDSLRERDRADVAAGLLAPWRYMVRWQGYSEDEAREECGLADASSALPVEA